MNPDRYAVIGHPVAHSRSPVIHAAFARQTGQALVYESLLAPLDGFAATVKSFATRRESPGLGCNVTVPFKFEAWELAHRRTERALLAGAANTLCFGTGQAGQGWLADNTDGVGLQRDIEHNACRPLAGLRVLLVGAGGAAAGVLGPLLAAHPSKLVLANRTAEKAQALVSRHAAWAALHGATLSAAPLGAPGEGYDIVINASASSLHGAASPVSARVLGAGALAVDLMYGAAAEPFLAWARTHGAEARDGLGMLVEQAAEAFLLWRGVRPLTEPVLSALRAEMDAPR